MMSTSEGPPCQDQATASFDDAPGSVSAARQYTTDHLADWGVAAHSVDASLIVSELATNALRHAHSGFELDLSHAGDRVRIVVSDHSVSPPALRDPTRDSGFGLHIVSEVASEWGFEVDSEGKRVWVLLGGE